MIETKNKDKVIIQLVKEPDVIKTKNLIENSIVNNFDIQVENLRNPLVKVVMIDLSINSKEQLEEEIKKRNILDESQKIKVNYIYQIKTKKTQTAIVELNREAYASIMKERKIYIGCQRCNVYDEFNVKRCFKCNSYGHSKAKCTNNPKYEKCADEHTSEECKNESNILCINCSELNVKIKEVEKKVQTNHKASDYKSCSAYKWLVKKRISNTDYPFPPLIS